MHDGVTSGDSERPPSQASIRVLVASPYPVVLEGLISVLNDDPNLIVTGMATNVEDTAVLALAAIPDVVILDTHLADGSAADAGRILHKQFPDLPLIILTGDDADELLVEMLEEGIHNFLPKMEATADRVRASVHRVFAGEILTSASALVRLLRVRRATSIEDQNADWRPRRDALTPREREVLSLMRQGVDSHTIATKLQVSYCTVRTHVHHILGKLDAHSQLQAIARAGDPALLAG